MIECNVMEGAVDSGLLRYKDHWIRCVAIPQKNRSGCWDCAVYVFVSDPSTSKLSPEDSCFQTVLHTLPSATSAMTSGLSHAQSLVDSSASGQ